MLEFFVNGYNSSDPQTIARLGPIGAGTTFHTFGYEDTVVTIKGKVVGLTDADALKACKTTGTEYTLVSPIFPNTDYLMKDLKLTLTNVVCQTLRPDLDEDAPVFDFTMELYLDES